MILCSLFLSFPQNPQVAENVYKNRYALNV